MSTTGRPKDLKTGLIQGKDFYFYFFLKLHPNSKRYIWHVRIDTCTKISKFTNHYTEVPLCIHCTTSFHIHIQVRSLCQRRSNKLVISRTRNQKQLMIANRKTLHGVNDLFLIIIFCLNLFDQYLY